MQFKPFCLGVTLCFLIACNNKPKDPIEGQQIEPIQVQRFDVAFFAMDTNNISKGIIDLYKNYPEFSRDFFSNLLQLDPQVDTQKIKFFYKQYLSVFLDVKSINAPSRMESDLNKALARFHFYFSDYIMPTKLVYYIGPMDAYSNVLGVNYIGVGLQATNVQNDALSQIPFYCLKNLLDDHLSNYHKEKSLLYHMIESGKRQFILNTLSVNTPDTLIWDYSLIELKAVKEQEPEIWQYLKEQHMLMSNERINFLNIMGDASQNSLLGAPLPGNIGKYIGFRIVESYMKKQTRTPWIDLRKLAATPASEIYLNANYQP